MAGLKDAISAYIDTQGVFNEDLIFFGKAQTSVDRLLVISNLTDHRLEPTRFQLFPALSLYVRDTQEQRQRAETLAWDLFRLFDIRGPLRLTETYKLSHVEPAAHPIDLGQDASGNWQWSLTINCAVPATYTI